MTKMENFVVPPHVLCTVCGRRLVARGTYNRRPELKTFGYHVDSGGALCGRCRSRRDKGLEAVRHP
jgi:hypothetical protein